MHGKNYCRYCKKMIFFVPDSMRDGGFEITIKAAVFFSITSSNLHGILSFRITREEASQWNPL